MGAWFEQKQPQSIVFFTKSKEKFYFARVQVLTIETPNMAKIAVCLKFAIVCHSLPVLPFIGCLLLYCSANREDSF